MGKTKMINSVRKIDVTVTELREIAWALDELAISVEAGQPDVTRPEIAAIRATRERIAPVSDFPRREGESIHERAFNAGYAIGRHEGAATGA